MIRTNDMARRGSRLRGTGRMGLLIAATTWLVGTTAAAASDSPPLKPVIEAEETVYRYEDARNGAGPMWCSGSTCLVRIGEDVFASGIETLPGVKPLNNCRWLLFHRRIDGWDLVQADPIGRTREPCPIAGFPDKRLFLSANPTINTNLDAYGGPACPEIIEFAAGDPAGPSRRMLPGWDGKPPFTEHSYRSFAADGLARETILFQNIEYTHAEWAFRDKSGKWAAGGQLKWPWGAEYKKPQPIRVCYPVVALKNRALHFCGVSDIVEPNEKWRAYKKEITGREWDYDFRRLFYTWTPDITTGKFSEWIEIASREKTCGWISPGDLWVAPDGAAHIVWTERAIDERLRDKFFPGEKQSISLKYVVLREGKEVGRKTLAAAEEGKSRETPHSARIHVSPDNRLFVFYYVNGLNEAGRPVSENRVFELRADGSVIGPVTVPFQHPLHAYFTATIRAGSPASASIELLGLRVDLPSTINYARARLY